PGEEEAVGRASGRLPGGPGLRRARPRWRRLKSRRTMVREGGSRGTPVVPNQARGPDGRHDHRRAGLDVRALPPDARRPRRVPDPAWSDAPGTGRAAGRVWVRPMGERTGGLQDRELHGP